MCPNGCKTNGTPTQMKKAGLEKHLASECSLRTNKYAKCCGQILWSEMADHLADRCIERIVECRHCAAILSFGKLKSAHLRKEKDDAAACVNSSVCPNDGCTHAHRKEAAEKHAAECDRRLVNCPCCFPPVVVPFCDVQTHVQQQLAKAAQRERLAKLLIRLATEHKQQAAALKAAGNEQEILRRRVAALQADIDSSKKRAAEVAEEEPLAKRAKVAES